MRQHGQPRYADLKASLTGRRGPACPKLTSYWHFEDCGYRKGTSACNQPDYMSACLSIGAQH